MRRETPFTLEEAKAYVSESVKVWENTNQTDIIIQMASYAYNRRTRTNTVSTAAKLKVNQKNINSLKLIMKRNTEINQKDTNIMIEPILQQVQNEYDTLVAEHGEPKAKLPKTKLPKTKFTSTRLSSKPSQLT